MKYAGKTFTLYASQPVAIQGSDSLYTYQNTGTGTATIVGSNNAVNWTSVATVVSGASYTGSHAYAFLMMTGSTEVSVSRGAAGDNSFSSSNPLPVTDPTSLGTQGTGASYDPPTGGTGLLGYLSGILKTVLGWTRANPLPVLNSQRYSGILQISEGRMWECPVITKTAVTSRYSAICLFNPTATDINMMMVAITVWLGSAAQIRQVKTIVDPSTLPAIWTEQTNVFANCLVKVSDSRVCPFKVYTADLAALDATTWYISNNTATTPSGSSNRGDSKIFEKGTGIIFECGTANITMNMYCEVAEES